MKREAAARYLYGPLGIFLYSRNTAPEDQLNPMAAKAAGDIAFRRSMAAVVAMGERLDAKFRSPVVEEAVKDLAEARSLDTSALPKIDARGLELVRPR